jgi:GntR family transcriptional regulator
VGVFVTVEEPASLADQIAAALRDGIRRGEYRPGSRLPSEDELARQYGVDRRTANTAVRALRAEGLARSERGRGTFVAEVPVITRHAMTRYVQEARERAGSRGAFDGEIRAMGLDPHTDVTVSIGPAPADVAEALQLDPGAEVIIRERHMYASGMPVQFATSYIPAAIGAGTQIAEVDSGPGGIISRMAELGHAQTRITETISTRPPTAQERAFLRLDKGQAVSEIWHIGWTADGRPVELMRSAVPAWQWRFSFEWPVD